MQKGKDYRSLDNEEQLLTVTLDEALAISRPAEGVPARRPAAWRAKGPLREFGTDPVSERPVVAKDGRFGVYVTDGETNASIGKGDRIEEMTPERAYELLAVRREQVAGEGRPGDEEGGKAPTKKAPAKKRGREEGGGEEAPAAPRSPPSAPDAGTPARQHVGADRGARSR